MVLVKLSILGRPTDLVNSKTKDYCAAIDVSGCCLGIFLSSILVSSFFFLPLIGRRPNID